MKWFDHSRLEGRHAFLSASKSHWLRYNEEKLYSTFMSSMDAVLGTRLHAFAAEAIKLGIRMPDNDVTLNAYINDAIGFRMTPEVVLMATDNAFGTADTICFNDNMLRIHDLKNGVTPAKMEQLIVYACYFMIEYKFKPNEIKIVLRIYQNDTYEEYIPTLDELIHMIDRIFEADELINKWKAELLS